MINLFLKTLSLSKEAQERSNSTAIPLSSAWVCLDCDTVFARIKEQCPACCSVSVTRLAPILNRDGGRIENKGKEEDNADNS